jgi:hypothetical protein
MIFKRIVIVLMSGLFAAAASAGTAGARQAKLAVPNDLQLLIMIKTTLIAFNDANTTGNYTVLRDLASPDFQRTNTAARLGEFFQAERNKNVDISPIVLLQPKLLRPPAIDPRGHLQVAGFFPSQPHQVNFALAFEVVAGKWRLAALGINTVDPKLAAAAPPPDRRRGTSKVASHTAPADPFIRRSWPYWIGYDYAPSAR